MDSSKKLTFGGHFITVREMTVQEVADLLDGRIVLEVDPSIDMLLDGRIGSEALVMCTDATLADMRKLTPSELQQLAQAVAEANPFFVRLLEKILAEQTPGTSGAE